MKKIVSLVLVAAMLFVFAACSAPAASSSAAPAESSSVAPAESTSVEPAPAESSAVAAPAEGEYVIKPKNGDKYRVGVVVKTLESAFYQRMAKALEKEYANSDTFEMIIQASKTETDTAGFIQIIEDMITKDIDLLIVVPGDPDAVAPTLENVIAAGIPVICSETDAPSIKNDLKLTYIGIDNVAAGKMVVDYAFQSGKVKKGDKVALITGPVGYTTADDRAAGALKGFEANGAEVVANQPADWDRTLGMQVAENIITANPDITYIAGSSGEMALGAAEAVASANLADKITVTGFDGIMDEYYAIQDGRLLATGLQDSSLYGLLAMEKYIEYLKGNKLEAFYDIGAPLVTAENVEEYIASSAEQ